MNFLELSFFLRLLFLFLFLSSISIYDFLKLGSNSTKWRECLYICIIGLIGSVYAVLIDLITSSISKSYFVIGKRVLDDSSFLSNVLLQGIEAGFIGGLLGSCILVYANNPKEDLPSISYLQLSKQLWKPALFPVIFGAVIGLLVYFFFPIQSFSFYKGVLTDEKAIRFVTVWGTHSGIYLGAITGFVWGGINIYKQRNRLFETA